MYNKLATIDEKGVSHSRYATYSHETDPYGRARLAFYFSMIQEAAGLHAAIRGLSITAMMDEGKTWVITRNRVTVHRYVRWGEVVNVKTWAAKPVRLHLPRIIEGYDSDGVLLFESTTLWAILDMESGRPQRPEGYSTRMILPDEGDERHPTTISIPKAIEKDEALVVVGRSAVNPTYDDTDRNRHVNNVS
ncbi:MAG: thioesterase, partial [Sphaerochaeta sp.]|nr:thioesterase [Sphaerochaeta sp.]